MKQAAKTALSILLSTIWVSASEFVRNELLVKSYWTEHYAGLGMVFPSGPMNGVIWVLWSLLFSVFVFVLSKKYSLLQTALLAWFAAFVLMWIVVGNLAVLPFGMLFFSVPLSLLEAFVAALITKKLTR